MTSSSPLSKIELFTCPPTNAIKAFALSLYSPHCAPYEHARLNRIFIYKSAWATQSTHSKETIVWNKGYGDVWTFVTAKELWREMKYLWRWILTGRNGSRWVCCVSSTSSTTWTDSPSPVRTPTNVILALENVPSSLGLEERLLTTFAKRAFLIESSPQVPFRPSKFWQKSYDFFPPFAGFFKSLHCICWQI